MTKEDDRKRGIAMAEPGASPAAGTVRGPVPDPAPAPRLQGRSCASPDRVPLLVWVIAGVFVAVELAVSGRYGFMQDELYFIAAGRHLAFGYVDQPPLTPLLTRATTSILGLSPTAVRIIPALAGGAVVVIAARLAALLRAGPLGQVLAALTTACAPLVVGYAELDGTTAVEMLAWAVVLLCVTTAVLRDRPRWWLGAGVAAGLGLEDNNMMVLLVAAVAAGILAAGHARLVRTRWPWLGGGIAAVIWAPNLGWQATHGWPQLVMAAALHQQNSNRFDYLTGLPAQLDYAGLLVIPLVVSGFAALWRAPELRFLAITVTLIVVYVLAWVPGKQYYAQGTAPVVLAAGSATAERWIARTRRPKLLRGITVAAPLVSIAVTLPVVLPVLPLGDVHDLPASLQQYSIITDTVGWQQLTSAVAAQDAALTRAGNPPTSIFAGNYGEAAALDVLGSGYRLPPVLSGHNAFWMWGPGRASDRVVLAVDALGSLRPYFASCRALTTYHAPYQIQNGWMDLRIGVCTRPVAGWRTLWPHLRHYD